MVGLVLATENDDEEVRALSGDGVDVSSDEMMMVGGREFSVGVEGEYRREVGASGGERKVGHVLGQKRRRRMVSSRRAWW